MAVTIKYIGHSDNYAELPVTGKQSVWQIGQQEERSDAEAALLLATGLFSSPPQAVAAIANPVTGGIEISVGGKRVDALSGGIDYLPVKGSTLLDITNSSNVLSVTTCTLAYDRTITRWGGATLKATPSAATAQIRKGSLNLLLDPITQMLSFDVYIPTVVDGSKSISISLFNSTAWSANNTRWSFNLNALRQGWNTVKCWCGDTDGAVGTGTLSAGVTKTKNGTGFDPLSAIGYFELDIANMSGLDLYFDQFRKACKAKTALVMGFDATGKDSSDNVMTKAGGVAEVMKAAGIPGYFTATYIYDLAYPTAADTLRKEVLYRDYGWDALPHFWNHGGSYPGSTFTAATAVRASNVVTFTATAAHNIPVGTEFYALAEGATPTDMNGLVLCKSTGATTITYPAAGTDGSATGTVTLKTITEKVINADNATTRAILRHELVDLVRLIKAKGWGRAAHIGAYPNNSVGVMEVTQPICAEAGIKFFRSIKKRTVSVSEFGVDNPLHFGSVEMGSGSTATTLTDLKNALAGAIGRGEHLWTYGHYVLDETDPANAAHANANLEYAPGQGGNPAPPGVSYGGWWYLGTIKRFINEAVLPAIAAGNLIATRPSDWAASLGNIDGSH